MKVSKKIVAVLGAAFLLGACSQPTTSTKTQKESKLNIMTTFFPMYDFTRNIVGEEGNVTLLISAGTEPHEYDPTAKDIAKISIVPGIFGINEPVMYGLPIVLNPIMAIPLIFTPAINIAIAWSAMSAGLVPLCNGIMLPGSTPPLISGFLLCGWQGALLQLVLILIDMAIYLPFIKALDMQFLKEEKGVETEHAV